MIFLKKHNTFFWIVFLLLFVVNLWIAAQIPYGVDDWTWGGSPGIPRLLSAELNSRYAGNLTEILVARFPWFKVFLMGLVFTLIPAEAAALALEADSREKPASTDAFLICLGAALMLTLPLDVWAQSYGWVAGFSNFLVSGLLLCFYHRVLLRRIFRGPAFTRGLLPCLGLFLFGFVMQLYLENVAVYAAAVSAAVLLGLLLRRQRPGMAFLALALGNLIGLVLMFSNNLYSVLLQNGEALDGYRQLTFSFEDGPVRILLTLLRRFLGDFAGKLWGNNLVFCLVISGMLFLASLRKKKTLLLVLNALYLIYFPANRFWGPFPLPESFPIHFLSGIAEPAFFLLTLVQIGFLWRNDRKWRDILWASWISVPLLILPLLPINSAGPRCYATTGVLLMQFCLLLALPLWMESRPNLRRFGLGLVVIGMLAVYLPRCLVYADIGRTKRERDHLISQAREGTQQRIVFPAYPHREYLWITDSRDESDLAEIRDFYHLPEHVELVFTGKMPWDT